MNLATLSLGDMTGFITLVTPSQLNNQKMSWEQCVQQWTQYKCYTGCSMCSRYPSIHRPISMLRIKHPSIKKANTLSSTKKINIKKYFKGDYNALGWLATRILLSKKKTEITTSMNVTINDPHGDINGKAHQLKKNKPDFYTSDKFSSILISGHLAVWCLSLQKA